jgi:hypothetical protein
MATARRLVLLTNSDFLESKLDIFCGIESDFFIKIYVLLSISVLWQG